MSIIKYLYKKATGTKARRQLISSLLFNFIAKLPGLLAIIFILPAISESLGADKYGQLLAALGLGASFCLPFDGFKTVGRRQLAGAFGSDDKKNQAHIFMKVVFVTFILSIILMAIVSLISFNSWSSKLFILICCFPIIAAFFDTFDSVRASFNEHYVTAKFQLGSQLIIYGLVIIIGLPAGAVLLSALVMQPYVFASLGTMILLLCQRKYLLFGHIKNLTPFFKASFAVMLASGILTSIMGFTIYLLSQTASPEYAAWIGTFYRLFITLLAPFTLILFPLTSFISIHWKSLSIKKKLFMNKAFVVLGLGFGAGTAGLIGFAGPYYIELMFDLPIKGDRLDIIALSIFLGAVFAQRSYTMLVFSFCEGLFISYSSVIIVAFGVACAAFSYIWLPITDVINVMFLAIGFFIPLLLVYESIRQQRVLREQQPA